MPRYTYNATTIDGKNKHGTAEAASEQELRAALLEQGLYLISTQSKQNEDSVQKLKAKELCEFCRALSTMLGAGISLIRAVNILLQGELSEHVRTAYNAIYTSLQRGLSLSESMVQQGGFPQLLISVIAASEASGQLDSSCKRMAQHYEKEYKMQARIRSATFYPAFLFCLTIVITIFIFNFVLPKFFDLFDGIDLPGITRAVIAISNAFSNYGLFIICGILLLVLVLSAVSRLPKVRLQLDKCKLRAPLFGKLLRIIYTARFSRTLSSLYASGLTILSALQNTRDTIGNAYISSQFDTLIDDVRNGESLSAALSRVDGFDKKLASSVAIGEQTGSLDSMLDSVADGFDYESQEAINKMISIIEPVMIIFMALIIGLLIISVMMPIMTLYDSIGNSYGTY